MKKILLATTLLAASTSMAMADGHIVWGASAAAGIAQNGTDEGGDDQATVEDTAAPVHGDDAFELYSSVEVSLTLSGSSDNGLTFGASFSTTVGTAYALGDEDGFTDEGGFDPMPNIFVSGSFGKVELADDDFDFFDDTNGGGDAKYSGTFGAISVGLIADVDSGDASVELGYSAGPIAVKVNADTYEIWNVEGTYTMGTIAITAATDESENSSLKVAYSNNGISASAQYNTSDESIDIEAGYSANGLSLNADTNTESNAWTVTAGYDLGGGLALTAGTNYTSDIMVGATMAF
jgi:hypothetical protein